MPKFDSKIFNPEAFGAYIKRIPNVKKSELARSRAVGSNEQAKAALATQTGSLYAKVPYFGRIHGSSSQNNDGATDITAGTTTTFDQGFVVASRMDSWVERNFSKNITAGVDFMDNVAAQIADYKLEVQQGILLKMLEGIYGMSTSGSTAAAKAASEFLQKHSYDVTGTGTGAVGASTLNSAIQKACGDNKSIFKLAIMHSVVATNLENLRLLEYMKQTDKDGVQRNLDLATWNGRLVLVDDGMPAESGYYSAESTDAGAVQVVASGATAGQVNLATVKAADFYPAGVKANDYVVAGERYITYALGEGAITLEEIGDAVPYEMSRDAAKNGGQDTLFVRDRYICGAEGLSFVGSVTASASNADLATGANWNVINDGTDAIDTKAIPICRILSRG